MNRLVFSSRFAAACAVFALAVMTAPDARAAQFGSYRGGGNPTGVAEFERWTGTDVGWALDFLPSSSWTAIESPQWFARAWAPSRYRTVYSIPLIPDTGGTLADGASGTYDTHFATLAQALVEHGEADAVLRLGWEFNGGWYRWSAASDPAAFAAYWRRIVTTMRSVPGAAFQFDWSPVLGTGAVPAERAYPGDAYVDYIGLDAYDQDWYPGWQQPVQRWQNLLTQPHGLRWHRDFAAAHGKPMTFPEWGLAIRPDGHGGGDDPYFIQKMHDWIAANNVAYALYFEFDAPDGSHRLMTGSFPQAAAKFRELFGPRSSVTTPKPGATPPPKPGAESPRSNGEVTNSRGNAIKWAARIVRRKWPRYVLKRALSGFSYAVRGQ